MQLHLDQHYDDAFDEWNAVTFAEEIDQDLRSLTWYWIGRERANLGQFTDAGRAFEQSLKDAPEARRYELQRLMLEMEFFDAGNYAPLRLIDQMQRLISATGAVGTDAADRALPHMRAVLGSMHHEVALECRESGDFAEARRHFEKCKTIFTEIRNEKWAVFGLAEALWWLGERKEAERLFATEARSLAQDEYIHRIEFRTKVLARSAELICCARATALREEADHVFHDVLDALGRVDARMTIYSEVQRRNVDKTTFLADMQKVLKQAKDVPDAIEG
jgi:tetratricopeptide (TPR) repeat protein